MKVVVVEEVEVAEVGARHPDNIVASRVRYNKVLLNAQSSPALQLFQPPNLLNLPEFYNPLPLYSDPPIIRYSRVDANTALMHCFVFQRDYMYKFFYKNQTFFRKCRREYRRECLYVFRETHADVKEGVKTFVTTGASINAGPRKMPRIT